jgi:hypothetical protein
MQLAVYQIPPSVTKQNIDGYDTNVVVKRVGENAIWVCPITKYLAENKFKS